MSKFKDCIFQQEKKTLEELINPPCDFGNRADYIPTELNSLQGIAAPSLIPGSVDRTVFIGPVLQTGDLGSGELGSRWHHVKDLELKHKLSGVK